MFVARLLSKGSLGFRAEGLRGVVAFLVGILVFVLRGIGSFLKGCCELMMDMRVRVC